MVSGERRQDARLYRSLKILFENNKILKKQLYKIALHILIIKLQIVYKIPK